MNFLFLMKALKGLENEERKYEYPKWVKIKCLK